MATTSRRRRVTGRDFEDEDTEEPRTRRRRHEDDDEDTTAQADEVEDEDEEPRSRRRLKKADDIEDEGDEDSAFDDSLVQTGWKAVDKARTTGEWTNDFRFSEDPQLVKFLTNEPWTYAQHWVTREGKRSFPCIGKGCPLCRVGVAASTKVVFAVMSFGNDPEHDEPQVMNLQTGPRFAETLKNFNDDPKVGPLDRLYWALSRSGTGRKTQYAALPVKERDLEDDWNLDPDEVLDVVQSADVPSPKTALTWPTRKQLQEIADEIME